MKVNIQNLQQEMTKMEEDKVKINIRIENAQMGKEETVIFVQYLIIIRNY